MDTDEEEQVQKLMAKVLMLETIQTSMCTFLATHRLAPQGFVDKVFDDAENVLRVMALARNEKSENSRRTVDLALGYLAENASAIRSALKKDDSEPPDQSPRERE